MYDSTRGDVGVANITLVTIRDAPEANVGEVGSYLFFLHLRLPRKNDIVGVI